MCHTEVTYLILSATMNILPLFNMVPIFLVNSDWMHVPPYKICNIIFFFHLRKQQMLFFNGKVQCIKQLKWSDSPFVGRHEYNVWNYECLEFYFLLLNKLPCAPNYFLHQLILSTLSYSSIASGVPCSF